MNIKNANIKNNIIIALFLVLWFIINLLQSAFTGLANDEAYYWMYSQYPAWGYFDHPPMVAVLISAGYHLFSNELGVRIIFCLLGTLTLLLTYKMTSGPPVIFILIASAIALNHTHVAGFLAIPDIPLVFFTALFFVLYKKYLEKDSYWLAVMLGLSVTGMFYSKYHGLLVIIFVFLSNLSLIKRKSAWFMVALVVAAMIPHLIWQIRHEFPTFRYHLITRSDGFEFENIINYLYSQVLIAGPLIAPLILYYALSGKSTGIFERSLKFTVIGFLVFFFLSSFRDHIEAHWTAAAYVPLMVLAHKPLSRHDKAVRWLRNLAVPTIILIMVMRIMAAFNGVPYPVKYLDEFNGWKVWAEEIKQTAKGRAVIFLNKYQFAAKYTFYTGDNSCSVNGVFARKSQYNLWNFEDSLAGKPVMLHKSLQPTGMIKTPNRREHGYSFIDIFQPYNRIETELFLPADILGPGDTLTVRCKLRNSGKYPVHYENTGKTHPVLSYTIRDEKGSFYRDHVPVKEYQDKTIPGKGTVDFSFKFVTPDKPGRYNVYMVYWWQATGHLGDPRPAVITVK
ncbi:MAG: glycosyltransferase family 39 protein [Bacteroidales bacterium]|nr:glycosyltransferase family 39 protein [Bacteroidales bacterium]